MITRKLVRRALADVFDGPLHELGASGKRVRDGALLYPLADNRYVRVEFDERERLLLVNVGVGEGAPPPWDTRPEALNEFPVDTLLQEVGLAGVDDSPLRRDGAGMHELGLVAAKYAQALLLLGEHLRMTPDLVRRLRERAVRQYDEFGVEDA